MGSFRPPPPYSPALMVEGRGPRYFHGATVLERSSWGWEDGSVGQVLPVYAGWVLSTCPRVACEDGTSAENEPPSAGDESPSSVWPVGMSMEHFLH